VRIASGHEARVRHLSTEDGGVRPRPSKEDRGGRRPSHTWRPAVRDRLGVECYLLDDEVLAALCAEKGHPELAPDLISARDEAMKRQTDTGAPPDDFKRVRGETVTTARRLLAIPQGGSTADVFLRDTLAPLLTAETRADQELREDLFGLPPPGAA